MQQNSIELASNNGGPLHYLGNRYLALPNLSGHMIVDHSWLHDMFSIIFSNPKGKRYRKCFEPFAGSASWSLAAMELDLAEEYVINDSNSVLINTHRLMRDNPDSIKKNYAELTKSYNNSQFKKDFFLEVIADYNKFDIHQKSLLLPFIINHSWSGIIFHDHKGNILYREHNIAGKIIPGFLNKANLSWDLFNKEVDRISALFSSNKVDFQSGDFIQALGDVKSEDFVTLNPPYPENERSLTERTGMYTELYSPKQLHEKLIKIIQQMENNDIAYFMTYGFYNPSMKEFVLYNKDNQIKNYFRMLGYPDCAFGMALDQMYFSPKFSIHNKLNARILPALDVINNKNFSPIEALEKFISLSKIF